MTDPSDATRAVGELARLRREIEALDRRIVTLLAERVVLGRHAAGAKRSAGQPIANPEREADVVRHAAEVALELGLPDADVREIFNRIIHLSRRMQEETP